MATLTQDQINRAADAARNSILSAIDTYINTAIEELGVCPADVSDEQYNEIIDGVFH
jgi:hypothetical protein